MAENEKSGWPSHHRRVKDITTSTNDKTGTLTAGKLYVSEVCISILAY